jgi:hypothetical protein
MKAFYAGKRIPVRYFVSQIRDREDDGLPGQVLPIESIFLKQEGRE